MRHTIFTLIFLTLLWLPTDKVFAQTCAPTPSGLVSWYRAEGNAGDSADGNNGVLEGNTTYAAGKVGQAFSLDGNGDRVVINNPTNLQLQNLTIEGWIKRSSPSIVTNDPRTGFNSGVLFSFDFGGYGFIIDEPTGRIALTHNGSSAVFSTATVTDTNYHHVAVTKSGNQVVFYVDGAADAPVTFNDTFTFAANAAAIGARGGSDLKNAFFGQIDELSIYNRALTPAEIQSIVAAGSAGKCKAPLSCTSPPSGIAAWLPGDGNANDISGSGNNGIVEGNVTFPAGKVAQAFGLDGTTADVKIPASQTLNVGLSNGMTIDAWINPRDVFTQQPLVEWNSGSNFGAHFWISVAQGGGSQPGTLYANLIDTSGGSHVIVSAPGLITANAFQHVAVTYDKSSGAAQLYLNGASVASASLGVFTPQTSYDAYLGVRAGGSGAGIRYGGLLDEVEIFNRALAQTEIQAIVNADSAGKCKPGAPTTTPTATPTATPTPTPTATPTATPTPSPSPTPTPTSGGNPQPAILTATGASNRAVVFPDPGNAPTTQTLVPGLPADARPQGVAYYGSDNALISDSRGSRIFVVKVSTAALLDTINTAPAGYNGSGTIAVAPSLNTALAMGSSNGSSNQLYVIRAPFNASSTITTVTLTGGIANYQTQAIVFNNAGRAFVYQTNGISVLDAPYTSVAFTIPVANSNSEAIAITPDGNTLLASDGAQQVRIFQAPFSASSTPQLLTIPGANGTDGIMVTPDGTKAIVVSAFARQAAAISAPFSSASTVETLPLPASNTNDGFEDVGISADSQLVILTGNSINDPAVLIRAPFTAAGATSSDVPIQNVANSSRGNGSVRFLPAGLAPGLTISKSAPATVASGSTLTYTISYGNTGTANAANVIIRDPLPAGTTFRSATNGGMLSGNNTVVFNIGAVNAGVGAQTVSFTVNVTAPGGSSVNNTGYTIEADSVAPIAGAPVTTSATAGPTAAAVSVGGRVTTASGRGITNARISLTDSQGNVRTTVSTAFGYYRFDDVQAGETYILNISAKHYQFENPTQVLNVGDEMDTVNFAASSEREKRRLE